MDLCAYESEDHECGVGAGVNRCLLLRGKARAKEKTYI